MSRSTILSSLGVFDWLLSPNGHIFMRDFYPMHDFAYKNHHHPEYNILNFKVSGGHLKFFVDSGAYIVSKLDVSLLLHCRPFLLPDLILLLG